MANKDTSNVGFNPKRGIGQSKKRRFVDPTQQGGADNSSFVDMLNIGEDRVKISSGVDKSIAEGMKSTFVAAYQKLAKLDIGASSEANPLPYHSQKNGQVTRIFIPAARPEASMQEWETLILALIIHCGERVEVSSTTTADVPNVVLSDNDKATFNGILSHLIQHEGTLETASKSDAMVATSKAISWLAAGKLASEPSHRGHFKPFAMPVNPVMGMSAGDYLTGRFKTLKQSFAGNEKIVETIQILLKLYTEACAMDFHDALLDLKIPWSEVLKRAGYMRINKRKERGKVTTVQELKLPINPASTAYLGSKERGALGKLMKPVWSSLDSLRERWQKLSSPDKHEQFDDYVKACQAAVDRMKQLEQTIARRLGHRKQVIEEIVKNKLIEVNNKQTIPQKVTVLLSNKTVCRALSEEQKAKFSPVYVLGLHPLCSTVSSYLATADQANIDGYIKTLSAAPVAEPIKSWFTFYMDTFAPLKGVTDQAKITIPMIDLEYDPLRRIPQESDKMIS